jgi:FAD:protein FMN transferase
MAAGPPAGVVAVACQAMATRFEIALWGSEEGHLRAAGAEALREVERLDAQLSLFRVDSDIADLNARAAREPVVLEPRVFRLLERAAALGSLTGGAFDITVTPLMRAWGLHGGKGTVPSVDEFARARAASGWTNLVLDAERSTARFAHPGCALDLGAIGKGYAVDQAVAILRECGIANALIHGGTSTAFAVGTQPDGEPWRVAIRHPRGSEEPVDVVTLSELALSVSAPHGKQFTSADRTYGHVIDPRTGEPAQTAALAAVTCDSATDSDALSTALLVLGEPFLPALKAAGARGFVLGPDGA